MFLSPETRAAITADLAAPNADIARISRAYGVPIRVIRGFLPQPEPASAASERFGGRGRPDIEHFSISRTLAGNPWPAKDAVGIDNARRSYDAGLIEMATGRDGDWLILYAFPRKRPAKNRLPYFKGMSV